MEYRTQKHSKMIPCAVMIAVLIILAAFSNIINTTMPFIKHGILLCYVVFMCWYILRFVTTEYIYKLSEDKIEFVKYQSKRETTVLEIAISDILYIGRKKNKTVKKQFPVMFAHNLTSDMFPKNSYIIVYRDGQYMRKIKIEATKMILMELKKRIPDVVRIGYLNKGEPIDGNY